MPKEVYRVNAGDIPQVVRQMNQILSRLTNRIAAVEGTDGTMFAPANHIDLQGKFQVKGVANSTDEQDLVTRAEARDNALYRTNGRHVATSPIVAMGGITLPNAVLANEAVALGQVNKMLSSVFAAVNATYVTEATEAGLPNSRKLAAGNELLLTDGGAGSTLTVDVRLHSGHFATLPGAPHVGDQAVVDNSSVKTWGGTADGAGAFTVLVWWNGSAWTVIGQ